MASLSLLDLVSAPSAATKNAKLQPEYKRSETPKFSEDKVFDWCLPTPLHFLTRRLIFWGTSLCQLWKACQQARVVSAIQLYKACQQARVACLVQQYKDYIDYQMSRVASVIQWYEACQQARFVCLVQLQKDCQLPRVGCLIQLLRLSTVLSWMTFSKILPNYKKPRLP